MTLFEAAVVGTTFVVALVATRELTLRDLRAVTSLAGGKARKGDR